MRCPHCGGSFWLIGRQGKECAGCSMPSPPAPAPPHGRRGTVIIDEFAFAESERQPPKPLSPGAKLRILLAAIIAACAVLLGAGWIIAALISPEPISHLSNPKG